MTIEYRKAEPADAAVLADICNAAFYSDYLRFGVCPGYGKTPEMMEASLREHPKYLILCDRQPVGCVSCKKQEAGVYEITCLCIVPAYQGKGLGTAAVQFVKSLYADWEKITLVTPLEKKENVKFYTEKCGFRIVSAEADGHVALARLVAERQLLRE